MQWLFLKVGFCYSYNALPGDMTLKCVGWREKLTWHCKKNEKTKSKSNSIWLSFLSLSLSLLYLPCYCPWTVLPLARSLSRVVPNVLPRFDRLRWWWWWWLCEHAQFQNVSDTTLFLSTSTRIFSVQFENLYAYLVFFTAKWDVSYLARHGILTSAFWRQNSQTKILRLLNSLKRFALPSAPDSPY